jgi:hypothetical protein
VGVVIRLGGRAVRLNAAGFAHRIAPQRSIYDFQANCDLM